MKKSIFLILLLILATGCSDSDNTNGENKEAKSVKAQAVMLDSVTTGYDYIGVVKAKDTKNYSFLMSGKISNIYVEKGQEFKKGQTLAKLDATNLKYSSDINSDSTAQAQANLDKIKDTYNTNIVNTENNINTLQTSINAGEQGIEAGQKAIDALEVGLVATKTNLDAAKKALDTAKEQLDAAEAVHNVGGISDLDFKSMQDEYTSKCAEYDAAEAKYDGSKAELEQSKAKLEQSKAEVESLKTQKINAEKSLSNLKVSRDKDVAAAQAVVNSSKTNSNITQKNINDTVITAEADGYVMELPYKEGEVIAAGYPVVVAKSKELVVTVGVADRDYASVHLGQKALINGKISGTVSTIAQYPDEGTRTYAVDILIPVESKFTIGETVNVKIITGNATGCYIPINAVFNIDGVDYVYSIDENNKVHRSQVTLGEISGDKVEIQISDPSAVVVTEGVKSLRENDTVTVEE
ncbi:MAG: efflux RND transporter periplasmic adaptor subunit [Lachnospirales bacterium]